MQRTDCQPPLCVARPADTHTDNSLTLLLRHDCGRSKEEAGQGPASRCAALHSWRRTGDGRHFRTSQKYNHVFGQQQEEDLRGVIAAGTGVGAITADA